MRLEASERVLQVDICPFANEGNRSLAPRMIARVRTRFRRRESVVEAISFDGDELLVLAFQGGTEEAKCKVERRGKHTVLGLGAEDWEGVGSGEVL